MSYKLGMLLSMIFVVIFFALGMDLFAIQYTYSDLDAKSVAISYRISEYGTIDNELIAAIENSYHVHFRCLSNCHPLFGDVVDYSIEKDIDTIIISNNKMTIAIQRSTVIGYLS